MVARSTATARMPSARYVSGRCRVTPESQSGSDVMGKNTPDRNIIGIAMMLLSGAATSSFFAALEIARPSEMKSAPPTIANMVSIAHDPALSPIVTPRINAPTISRMKV